MKWNQTTVFLVLFGAFLACCMTINMSARFKEAMTADDEDDDDDAVEDDMPAHVREPMTEVNKNKKIKKNKQQDMNKKINPPPVPANKGIYCPGTSIVKEDKEGTNCYGFCPNNASLYKTDPAGSQCYGLCKNSTTLYKTDKRGSQCFGLCPDTTDVYKKDTEGSNCYGYCDDGITYKTDSGGNNCNIYGYCEDNTPKVDSAGSNCPYVEGYRGRKEGYRGRKEGYRGRKEGYRGRKEGSEPYQCSNGTSAYGCCPDGTTMSDAAGSRCYGLCPDGKTYKVDAAGSNCSTDTTCNYGMCPDGVTCKVDASGSNCKGATCKAASGDVYSAFGCCIDGSPMSDAGGTNCAAAATCNYGMCPDSTRPDGTSVCKLDAAGSNCYGFCPDGTTYKTDASGSNCAANRCNYGMCPDNLTCKTDAAGSNCYPNKTYTCVSATGPVASAYGCCADGSPMTDAGGKNCAGVVACNFGKCTDGITCKADSVGSNCAQYPPPLPTTCESSMYGCCPDNLTTKNANGSNCGTVVQPTEMAAGIIPYNTSTVFIPPPSGVVSSTPQSCPEPQPCPPCARCPEPAFDCKKVPNYERTDNERYVPQAVLTDFSSFGM